MKPRKLRLGFAAVGRSLDLAAERAGQTFELLEIPSKRLRVFNGRRVVTQGRKRLDAEVHTHNSLVFAIGWSVLDRNRQAHKPTIGGARHHRLPDRSKTVLRRESIFAAWPSKTVDFARLRFTGLRIFNSRMLALDGAAAFRYRPLTY